ncbi:MAG: PD40 domain-containing protein [Acidobacteria bacterium]|nr:PD40 domain-containing protein [Acidobacteriota bacterium]
MLLVVGAGLWFTRFRNPQLQPRLLPLTTYAGFESTPSFSPDGKRVSFTWRGEANGNADLYVKLVGGTMPLRLTTDPTFDGYSAWSPDGEQIAFFGERDGGGIYLVSPDGGPQRKLSNLSTFSRPVWSVDGKSLLVTTRFREKLQKGDGALWLIPAAGEAPPRRLLSPPDGAWFVHPALAPNGRTLAFASCTGAIRGQSCTLQLVDLQGEPLAAGVPRQITTTNFGISGIAWTPDGSSLIYSGGSNLTSRFLYRFNLEDRGQPERLELAGANASSPAVDSKSSRLAFIRTHSTVGLMRLELGQNPAPFLPASRTMDNSPQYSPDGSRIAFNSDRHVTSEAVWTANADGTDVARIVNMSSHNGTPRWSPDGRSLAFDALRQSGGWDIWTVAASGSSPQQLTHDSASNVIPSWSRDGKSIYFTSNRTGRFEIWRIPSSGGAAVQITRNGGHTAFESTDGKTLYYTITESGTEGLYAKTLPEGEERRVIREQVALRGFAVFDDGIYYLLQRSGEPTQIRFHPFTGGQARTIAEVEGNLHIGFTVSPDRKTFLFSKWTNQGADLMLIENFR